MTSKIPPLATEYPPDPEAGLGTLATSRGNLPLDAVNIHAAIAGTSASVDLTQEFRNTFDVPLEATYVFPLPDRAAVTALRMECADHVVEGVLKERSQARLDYDEAIAAGQRAALAEEDRPDVFTMRLGNILPGERVTVRLTLAQPLPYEDGEVTFRFPLVVAPRYIPGPPLGGAPAGSGTVSDTSAVPDASRITPPVLLPGFPNPVRLTLTAGIDPAGLPVTGIRSSLYAVSSQDQDGHTVVSLRPGERLDRDFILRLALASRDETVPSLVLTPDSGDVTGDDGGHADDHGAGGTLTFTIFPPVPAGAGDRPRDVVLVLDRSGSMGGWKIVAARRAAGRIIDTLTSADRFAVLAFDHGVGQPPDLPDGLSAGTDRNRYRAVEWLARTDARGGTQMLEPLERSVRLLTSAGDAADAFGSDLGSGDRDRVIVLVTDGQVGNEDQILASLSARLAGIRVHAVGIDRAVNAGFLARLAAAGRGRCELVESEDRLDDALVRIHRRISAPLVTGLALTADGLAVDPGTIAPGRLPDLFPGVPLTITGRWHGQPSGTVTVRGTAADGTAFECTADGTVGGSTACRPIWARAHLRDLEDRYVSFPGRDAALDQLEEQITGVSLRHGVLCRFTAFVAVDSRVVTDETVPHRVAQPVELPSGWDLAAAGAPAPGGAVFGAAAGIQPQHTRTGRASAKTVRVARGKTNLSQRELARLRAELSRSAPPSWLLQARRQVADEVAALRAAREAPEADRVLILADLATRLRALLAWLAGDPAAAEAPPALTALAGKLAVCDQPAPPRGDDLRVLWEETVRVLEGFAGSDRPQPAAKEFWKRPR